MPSPFKKKKREETRSIEELALLSALNSEYNLLYPMVDPSYVRVRNPLTGLDPTFRTDSDSFRQLIDDLCQKGLGVKLSKEFDYFAKNYNTRWSAIKMFAMPENFLSSENPK